MSRLFNISKLFINRQNITNLKSQIYNPLNYPKNTLTTYPYERKFFSKKFLNLILTTGIGGALVGIGYSYFNNNTPKLKHISNDLSQSKYPFLEEHPNIQPSRQIIIPTDKYGLKISLFQYATCPFCCKVRAFLDYYGISYDIIEVNPVLKTQMSWTSYKKVPLLLCEVDNGFQQIMESSMIISLIKTLIDDQSNNVKDLLNAYPSINYVDENGNEKSEIMNRYFLMLNEDVTKEKNEQLNLERIWRIWADDVLVHVLSPNVYRTLNEALDSFYCFSEKGDWERTMSSLERYFVIYVGAFAMWIIGKRLQKRYNLKSDVRCSLYDECNRWTRELQKRGTRFMGGDTNPNLADLAVYGILSSIEGCKAFDDALKNTKISTWYYEMQKLVSTHHGLNH